MSQLFLSETAAMGRTHLIFCLGGRGGHFPFWNMNVFFSITICKNYFHQKKSLQELFFAIQCYFIIPRKKTWSKETKKTDKHMLLSDFCMGKNDTFFLKHINRFIGIEFV